MELPIDAYPQATLTAGAVLLYGSGRMAAAALAADAPAPGRRAVGHWLPIAAMASVAGAMGQIDFALAIVFATSVASLGLVGGCIAFLGKSPGEPETWPPSLRKSASMLLPATVLVFIAGFAATITVLAASLMLAMGLVIVFLRLDPRDRATAAFASPRASMVPFLIAAVLSGLGGFAAVHGAVGVNAEMDFSSPVPVVATILSPLLVASMLLSGATLAQHGKAWAADATNIGVAQLNLGLLLPLLALAWRARHDHALYYPMSTWRVDAVALIVLAAALLPSAAGRWRPGWIEGAMFIVIYVAYVLANIVVSVMV
jgi:hypothetical protein